MLLRTGHSSGWAQVIQKDDLPGKSFLFTISRENEESYKQSGKQDATDHSRKAEAVPEPEM